MPRSRASSPAWCATARLQHRDHGRPAFTAATELYDEFAANDADFKTIFDNWSAFRTSIFDWHKANEFALPRLCTGRYRSFTQIGADIRV